MSFLVAQLQPYALAGGGAVAGATSITLKSFQSINGVNLAMSDFGSVGFGTLEPGNGTQEEQISFTGIVQNSNGSATLTGVKTVLFLSPYTESSGLSKTHPGSTAFVISNTAGFYNEFAVKSNDETITGQWTFDSFPITPSNSNASTTVKGVTKLSVPPISATDPIAAGDNDPRLPVYAASSTGNDSYAITVSPAPTAYAVNQHYFVQFDVTNTGAATLDVNGLGAKSILSTAGTALSESAIGAGQVIEVVYDGTQFRLVSSTNIPSVISYTSSTTWNKPTGLKFILVELQAPGGGAGYAEDNGGGDAQGGGGGGGGYTRKLIAASALGSSETVTIGAVGTGGTSGTPNGTAGGTTSFGSIVSATGGSGGSGGLNAGGAGGAGGTGTGGDISLPGQAGTAGVPANAALSGRGGNSHLGWGAYGVSGNSDGIAGTNYGGGGSGASRTGAGGSQSGGAGGAGIIVVTEYF